MRTIVAFGDPISYDIGKLKEKIKNIQIDPFQATFLGKALAHVIDEFRNARDDSKKILISVTDGYVHPYDSLNSIERAADRLTVGLEKLKVQNFLTKTNHDF